MKEKENIYAEIGDISRHYSTREFIEHCLSLSLSAAPVNSIREVAQLEYVKNCSVRTGLPGGREAVLSPASHDTEFLVRQGYRLKCAPRLGEDNVKVFSEAGIMQEELERLNNEKVI